MTLTISRRLGLLLLLAVIASFAIIIVQLLSLRASLQQDRKNAVLSEAQTAVSIVENYVQAVGKGELSKAEAQERAKATLRSIRFGQNDYVFVYRSDAQMLAHPNPDLEGKNFSDLKDANGFYFVREMMAVASHGGGFVDYWYPRAGSDKSVPKLTYVAPIKAWDWVIGTGVYIDDIDTAFYAAARSAMFWGLGVVAGLCIFTMLLARGLVRPLKAITATMAELASGNHQIEIPFANRKDEVGAMAKALAVFRVNAIEQDRLEHERKEAELRSAEARRAELEHFANRFETTVGGIIGSVSSAASKLETAATALTGTADLALQKSATVTSASQGASASIGAVATATNEMTASIAEISRQVQASSRVAEEAVRQAEVTDARVGELSQAASRIGDVVRLITAIAEQTNLLALNATIEAARAGEAGKGFAVVAQEVKALAAQTAKATDQIGAQISTMQSATQESVVAIKEIGLTIGRIAEIASTIASAVEEQNAATAEISRSLQHAAAGTAQVTETIVEVHQGAEQTGVASSEVLNAAGQLAVESGNLTTEVSRFLDTVRAA